MKLYSKRGDDGFTDLGSGTRVQKDSLRIDAIGEIDELNSLLGLAHSHSKNSELSGLLGSLQNLLFEAGAELATPVESEKNPRIRKEHIRELEQRIDGQCQPLAALTHFILPGGSPLSSTLHVARSVARRAERACVALSRDEKVSLDFLIFLNRISDLLFAMARRANQLDGLTDVKWPR